MKFYELLNKLNSIVPAVPDAEVIMVIGGAKDGVGFFLDSIVDDTEQSRTVYLVREEGIPDIKKD